MASLLIYRLVMCTVKYYISCMHFWGTFWFQYLGISAFEEHCGQLCRWITYIDHSLLTSLPGLTPTIWIFYWSVFEAPSQHPVNRNARTTSAADASAPFAFCINNFLGANTDFVASIVCTSIAPRMLWLQKATSAPAAPVVPISLPVNDLTSCLA